MALRAIKLDLNSALNSMPSAPSKTVCSTPNKNQSHNASPASAQPNVSGMSMAPSTASSISVTSSTSSTSSSVSSQNQSSSARDENHTHANKPILTRDQQPLQNSIIPTTAPVAFAAVAKHSTSQHTANEGILIKASRFLLHAASLK